jgi:ABC-type lipoprotein release transport system permease subunit
MSGNESIIIGFVGTVLTTLCGVVAVLYNQNRKDIEECRQDRERLWSKIADLQTEIGKLLRGA